MMKNTLIGALYHYENGQARVEFHWDGRSRDGYVWSVKLGQRLASYRTRHEVEAAYRRSDNSAGAYGCVHLVLSDNDDVD